MSYSMCYCCLASDCTKDIFNEYYSDGSKEIYSEMILNTFNVTVSHHINYNMICEQCISDLRKASELKMKVIKSTNYLLSEKSLKTENERNSDDLDDKTSVDIDETAQSVANGREADQVFVTKLNSANYFHEDIKKSPMAEIGDDFDEDDIKDLNQELDAVSLRTKCQESKKRGKQKRLKQKTKQPEPESQNHKDLTQNHKELTQNHKELTQNHKELKQNSLNLVFYSNLCLFKSLKTKFGCFICREAFLTMKELRNHSKMHSNAESIRARFNRWRGLSYQNADISNLECKKCSQACIDLNDLKKHLIKEHDVKFETAEHFLIPYKVEDSFNCVLCNAKFKTYMTLSVHMNKHYSNNVCEICGNSYINRISLRIHHTRHKEKKCILCSETFLTNYSRVRHMRTHHNSCTSKRYCLVCGKTFRYAYQLMEHKILEHGAKRELSKCTLCPKTFPSTQNLKNHVRSVHVRERNFPCNVCEMRFFTKFDQKRHEKTHVDERSFACELCESKFKGKDSLRRHLKRQHLGV